jgi:hypothetical protein
MIDGELLRRDANLGGVAGAYPSQVIILLFDANLFGIGLLVII